MLDNFTIHSSNIKNSNIWKFGLRLFYNIDYSTFLNIIDYFFVN